MNPPVDAYGNPVTIGDLTSRPLPPAPAAVAVFAAPAPGAVNQELREDILRIFGKEGENILRHLTSANLGIYLKKGMYIRYQRTGNPVPEAEFVANLKDYITERDKKGGKKNKRKSMKGKSMKRKSMKRKSMKRKSMKRKNIKRKSMKRMY